MLSHRAFAGQAGLAEGGGARCQLCCHCPCPAEPMDPRWPRLPPAPGSQAGSGAGSESPDSKDRPLVMPRGQRGLRSTLSSPCQPGGREMAQLYGELDNFPFPKNFTGIAGVKSLWV